MENRISADEFYQFLNTNLVEDPNISRDFISFDLMITGVGEEFLKYISVGNANVGITSSELVPTFTNLSEGYGVFPSRSSTLHKGYEIDEITIDSLKNNFLTKDLNFQF